MNYPADRTPQPRVHAVPVKVQTVGMLLFLLTLAIVFLSGMLIYVIVRAQASGELPLGTFRGAMTDWKLFASTAVVLAASFAIHRSLRAVQLEKQAKFKTWLWITNLLAILFVIIQTPAMAGLLALDPGAGSAMSQVDGPRPTRVYAWLFLFVLIHAAHVLGGIIYLAVVTIKAHRGFYDHEHYVGVRHAGFYWHFLDVVWIAMFGLFFLMG
jgi:heme/copper-type cytochrome/quinol oxidase subunit 3